MEPETWLALAAFFGTSGTALCIVLVKYKFRRNSNSIVPTTDSPDCVEDGDCDERMVSQEKLFNSKLETVEVKIDAVKETQVVQSKQLDVIGRTTTDILKAVKVD